MTWNSRRTIALAVAVAIALPLLGSAVAAAGLADRMNRSDAIPIAIVNNDQIVTGDRPMAAGRALTDALVHHDGVALGWVVTDETDAAEGLRDGDYYAVLTIPEEFSASVLSAGGDHPVATEVTLETDPGASAAASAASQVVARTATETLGREVTTAFVSSTVTGIDQLSTALSDAATGAGQLADGTGQVRDGTVQVASGTTEVADGLQQLSTGADDLAAGSHRVADGATSLSGGAADLRDGTAGVASGTARVGEATSATAAGSRQLADGLAALASSCPPTAGAQYCAAVAGAATTASSLASSAGQAAAGAATTANGAQTLSTSSGALVQGAADLAAGARDSASGADRLAAAAASAATGADTLSTGATDLAAGATDVASGAEGLATKLSDGAAAAPTYTDDQITQIADVVAQPVTVATTSDGSAAGWLPAVIAAAVLWIGAIATLAIRSRALSAAALVSPTSSGRLTRALLRRNLAIGAAQGVAVTAMLAIFRIDLAAVLGFGALAVLAALTFVTLVSGLHVLLGRWAIVAIALLTLLEASTLSGALPLQTAPSWLAAVAPFLPVSAFLRVGAQVAEGTVSSDLIAPVVCLALWSLVGAGLVLLGIRRSRSLPAASPSPGRRAERMAT
ncbi:MAG: YhgE/Pip family protein [Microbacterium sp.]|uniref:YhgE/Pip family protein n=1 Tax=Microbacterium sp. TaxID=51671 RepID=UPI001ACDB9E4|nr:YhgE/Pip family protein [Microbacterium sp.]MBN9211486.1 YhgE/Pip family protein [Microbacterium sp.]